MSITCEAYSKLLMHACKYPYKPVLGYLINSSDKSSNLAFEVTDILPICHSNPTSFILDLAADIVVSGCHFLYAT